MVVSRSLADPPPGLVADASAVINLIASGVARLIAESFPVRLRVVSAVASELAVGTTRGWNSSERLATLVDSGSVEIVELEDSSHECFESLVMGTAVDTLDDGEAATIAYARATGTAALIDERKARRICAARFPELFVHTTVDLLTSAYVAKMLGQAGVGDAVFNALSAGRMRVPAADYQRVVTIIGAERAKLCTSLPDHIRYPHKKFVG
jgi:predicted nucleic acid-binding protein